MQSPAPRSPRKAKGQGGERREEILTAALRLFVEQGLDSVSTRQIAEAAGISQATLYAYFPTKDDIGHELHIRAFGLLAERLATQQRGPVDAVADVAAMMRVYIDFGLENPDMYRIAFMTMPSRNWLASVPQSPAEMSSATQSTYGTLADFIAALHAEGRTADVDPETLTQCVWSAMHGLVSLLIVKQGFPWSEREHLIKSHTEMIARGLFKA